MRIAIITVAGISNRFNHGVKDKVLKAIYYEGDPRRTLLFRQCRQCRDMDRIILVGGYQYEALSSYVERIIEEQVQRRILLVRNEHYEDWSSGYSLHRGLETAFQLCDSNNDEIVFLEGDLALDAPSLAVVMEKNLDVITFNKETIDSSKSVVVYEDGDGEYRYVFSREHGLLQIDRPFRRIWNSGQVWKFRDMEKLKAADAKFLDEAITGTNLEIIQRYFDGMSQDKICVLPFRFWVNCNKREDWRYLDRQNFWEAIA